jgi:transcriptional regulator with XRE-family HTH domain
MAEGGYYRRQIAEQLLAARKDVGLTQKRAADRLDIDPSAISRWERGETLPSLANIAGLADIYGLDELDLQRTINAAQSEDLARARRDYDKLADQMERFMSDARDVLKAIERRVEETQQRPSSGPGARRRRS